MKLELAKMFHRDDLQQAEAKKKEEKTKAGQLRAGNSGIFLEDGNMAGACPRKAYLRLNGIDIEPSDDRFIMFEFGRENETIIIDKLKRQIGNTFDVTGDDVNSFSWKLPSGRTVSGRPDVVISSKNGTALATLELKMVASLWTARDVVFNNSPKLAHIIQASHAMIKLGCPAKLVYIQPVDFQTPMWANTVEQFPQPGEPFSELIEYTEKEVSGGRGQAKKKVMMPKKVVPSRTVYDLEVDITGCIKYRREESKEAWTVTPVSQESIEAFYRFIDEMPSVGLGPRPLSLKACGDFENYTQCQYCELAGICDRLEKQDQAWLDECKQAVAGGLLKK